MRPDVLQAMLVAILGGTGTWLLLPHQLGFARPRSAHVLGGCLVAASLLTLALFWSPPAPFLMGLFFYVFAIAGLACSVLMITARNPVHSALWFAAVVLATTGLFVLLGASFLAAGTIIVYAGAIIVTFLFVIMLAQSGGEAAYDRSTRMPARASLSTFLLLWSLLYCLLMVQSPDRLGGDSPELRARRLVPTAGLPALLARGDEERAAAVVDRAVRAETARLPGRVEMAPGVPAPHVAGLGGTLFTDHLIAVEVAGAILFVALVGAAAIATPKPPVRPKVE
jgi:NADH-quinone oxidoreductase subunit J